MYIARPELGLKHQCARCAVRFYDLRRVPAQCPACHAEQPPPAPRTRAVPRTAGTRWPARSGPREEVAAEAVDEGAVPLLESPDPQEDEDDVEDEADVIVPDEEEERG